MFPPFFIVKFSKKLAYTTISAEKLFYTEFAKLACTIMVTALFHIRLIFFSALVFYCGMLGTVYSNGTPSSPQSSFNLLCCSPSPLSQWMYSILCPSLLIIVINSFTNVTNLLSTSQLGPYYVNKAIYYHHTIFHPTSAGWVQHSCIYKYSMLAFICRFLPTCFHVFLGPTFNSCTLACCFISTVSLT